MAGRSELEQLFGQGAASGPGVARLIKDTKETKAEGEQGSCSAFGYLRGLHEHAQAVKFRLRTGNSEWYPYSLLSAWRYNPSVGLLLKFAGDIVTLVLIRGSNLDMQVGDNSVNLTDRGLQRHRILWVREMDEDEIRGAGEGEPTVDCIDIVDFEGHKEAQEWLKKNSPEFVRR